MKLIAKITSAHSPLKISPASEVATSNNNHVVAVTIKDAKHFIKDFAALFQAELVSIHDKLVGAIFHDDRTLYCGKRSEWSPKLECNRSRPFVVELLRANNQVYLNEISVSEVRNINGRTIYALPYGDIELDYIFPIAD